MPIRYGLYKFTKKIHEKINELKSIAKDTVDIKAIGFYSLGSARKNLDESQKKKYFTTQKNLCLKINCYENLIKFP